MEEWPCQEYADCVVHHMQSVRLRKVIPTVDAQLGWEVIEPGLEPEGAVVEEIDSFVLVHQGLWCPPAEV